MTFASAFVRAVVTVTVPTVGLAAPAYADLDPDATYAQLLASDGVLFNFQLEKYQGQRLCKSLIDGQSTLSAIGDLMDMGSYSFDVANSIASSATVAYCECASSRAEGVRVIPSLCSPFELAYMRQSN